MLASDGHITVDQEKADAVLHPFIGQIKPALQQIHPQREFAEWKAERDAE